MPLYSYRCKECEKIIDIRHSYKEQISLDCLHCSSQNSLIKNLSAPVKMVTVKKELPKGSAGVLVNKAITDGRQDIENQQKDLKSRQFEDLKKKIK